MSNSTINGYKDKAVPLTSMMLVVMKQTILKQNSF